MMRKSIAMFGWLCALSCALSCGLPRQAHAAALQQINDQQREDSVRMLDELRVQRSPLLRGAQGVLVAALLPEEQAGRAGVQIGDVVVRYADQPVSDAGAFVARVAAMATPVRAVEMVLLRNRANVVLNLQTGRLGMWPSNVVSLAAATHTEADLKSAIFAQMGHPGQGITSLRFSPDGRLALSGSNDNTMKLWDVASRRELRTFSGHTGRVLAAAFSADGRFILSGGGDKTVRLWDAQTGRNLSTMTGVDAITSVAFSPDGRQAAVGGSAIMVWDVATGTVRRTLRDPGAHSEITMALGFTPDGAQLLAGGFEIVGSKSWPSQGYRIKQWDVASGTVMRFLEGHDGQVQSIAVSADGKRAVSGSMDKSVKVWDLASGAALQTLRGHSMMVHAVAISADGRQVLSGSIETKLWDAASGRELFSLDGPGDDGKQEKVSTYALAFSPDGRQALSGTVMRDIRIWDTGSGKQTGYLRGDADWVHASALSPDGRQVATGGGDSINVWQPQQGKVAQRVPLHRKAVSALAFSPDGRSILGGYYDNTMRLTDIASGREIRSFSGHSGAVTTVSFNADGSMALSGGGYRDTMWKGVASAQYDGSLRLWNVASGETVRIFKGHAGALVDARMTPDGRQVVSLAHDGLRVWDTASGNMLQNFSEAGLTFLRAMALSPDGRQALVAGVTLTLIDLASGSKRSFDTGGVMLSSVAFSADGKQALSGGMDNAIRLWDVDSGKLLRTLSGHAGEVGMVAFSKDGRQVVSSSQDGTVRSWDLASGKPLVQMIAFSDGEWLTMTPEGYFSASSPKAGARLNISRGFNVYGADQFFDVFYRPDIVDLALSGKDTAGLAGLTIDEAIRNPPPVVAEVRAPEAGAAERVTVGYRVQSGGGGIGEVRVFHNGKLVGSDGIARKLPDTLFGKKADQLTPEALVSQMRSLSQGAGAATAKAVTTSTPKPDSYESSIEIEPVAGDNEVAVIAFNAQNSVQSPLRMVSFKSTRPAVAPRLHILAIGIDNYKDKTAKLKFAVKDAGDLGARWQAQAANIYGAQNITLETLTDAQATRAGILAKIDQIAARVKPTDHFLLFIASHGVLLGDQYYMVTNDYDGVLTPAKMISSNEIVDFSKRIKALSQLYILDTCHAGGMGGVVSGLYDARVSVLAKKMGLHIFASASSAEEALDGFEGNGLFTHTLLAGLDNNPQADANTDRQVSLTELGTYSKGQTRDIATRMKHKQDPLIINFGQDNPVYRLH